MTLKAVATRDRAQLDALAQLETDHLIELIAENAGLRAALALAEGASVRRELISNELKHRIGDLLTVVQVLARKTFRSADAACLEDFTARLGALAAAQAILIDAETKPAMLSDVVRDALAPHLTADNRSIVSGEAVAITGRHAHALTLALHELATNSIKYGALSVRGGLLEILWTFVDGELDFLWRESNGPPVMTPTRIGFGSSLITQNLKAAFAGALDLSFKSSGVECRLRAQLPENVAA